MYGLDRALLAVLMVRGVVSAGAAQQQSIDTAQGRGETVTER